MSTPQMDHLLQIAGHDPEDWQQDEEGDWSYEGENGDGDASWSISSLGFTYLVTRSLGWYVQSGEADTPEAVLNLTRAMDAACKAFNAVLQADG